jgi:hypothetical protein
MSDQVGQHPIFQSWAGRSDLWGPDNRWSASFGGDVLNTVTSGLDDYLALPWSWHRWSAALGCVPWLTDEEVVDRLLQLGSSCIVINKPDQVGAEPGQVRRLHDEGPGFPPAALPEFHGLAPREDGQPAVLGPYDDPLREGFKSVRAAGISKQQGATVPLVHAKLLLLGEVSESEGEMGENVIFFQPRRAWLGSANFTYNSRRSLEFGLWVDDPSLLEKVNRFLTDLLMYSELLTSYELHPEPERIPYEFDDAMYEYLREHEAESDDENGETP